MNFRDVLAENCAVGKLIPDEKFFVLFALAWMGKIISLDKRKFSVHLVDNLKSLGCF
jgi:hypothetical protein